MKKKVCILVLALFSIGAYSQYYDLIVLDNGDSLACNIDSISDSNIYLDMYTNGVRVNSYISKQKILLYQHDVIKRKSVVFYRGSSKIKYIISDKELKIPNNAFKHRYLFAPSAYPVKKDELYYSTIYFIIHDLHYGFGDHFSGRFGTSSILMPYYFLPQYSFRLGEKSNFALGDLLLFQPFDDLLVGNLAYGLYSYGSETNNLSLGAGLWSTNKNHLTENGNYPAITLSGKVKVNDNTDFISENYFFQMDIISLAERGGAYNYEEFSQLNSIAFGMMGFRFQRKKKKIASWDVGLLYIFMHVHRDIPEKYLTDEYTVDALRTKINSFVPIPTISYNRKILRR